MAGKIHSGGTVHFRLRGDRRVVRRDGGKTLTVDRRTCAARLQRSLFPADRLARAPGRTTPLAVRSLPRGRARPGRLHRSVGSLPLKSSIITFAGAIQEVMCDPEITIAIFSVIKPIAEAFLNQIKEEFEQNEKLKQVYPDVLYALPRQNGSDGRPAKWGVARGIMVKRKSNPKEATIEAHGLIDGKPTSRHFRLHIYDTVVTQVYLSD